MLVEIVIEQVNNGILVRELGSSWGNGDIIYGSYPNGVGV